MQQLALDLGVVSSTPIQSVVDPYWDEICSPTLKVGDKVYLDSPFTTNHPTGEIIAFDGEVPFVRWDSGGGNHINIDFIKLAHQHSQYESVGEQVTDTTSTTCSPTHFVEIYWVKRGDKKHNYFRYTWMEGRKMHRKYIGSTTSEKAIAVVEKVREAIALGKSPHEIVEIVG